MPVIPKSQSEDILSMMEVGMALLYAGPEMRADREVRGRGACNSGFRVAGSGVIGGRRLCLAGLD